MNPTALTGEAAAAYVGLLMDAAGRGRTLSARAVARDALLASRSNRAALNRLRYARVARVSPRPTAARAPRRRARALHLESGLRGSSGTGRCKALSRPRRAVRAAG